MKKAVTLIVLILLMSLTLVACNSPNPPGSSWADNEILEYKVIKDGIEAGIMTTTIKRNLSAEQKTLNGKDYSNATSRLTINYTFEDQTLIVESLLNDFSPLATYKKVTTAKNDYELSSDYSGKYYNYILKEKEQDYLGKIKIKAEFIDNDLLYTYIRCQTLSTINKAINIPIPQTNDLQSFSIKSAGAEKISVPFPSGEKQIDCHKIAITRTQTPIGQSIYAYFTPDSQEYVIPGGLLSIHESSKLPVKIVENNITYQLTKITVL